MLNALKLIISLFLIINHYAFGNDVLSAEFEALQGKVESEQSSKTLSSARNLFAPVGVSFHKVSPEDTSNYHL